MDSLNKFLSYLVRAHSKSFFSFLRSELFDLLNFLREYRSFFKSLSETLFILINKQRSNEGICLLY